VDDVGESMHHYPAAPFLRPLLVLVFRVHLLEREVAVLVLEPTVIHSEEFAEDLTLDLFHEVVDGVAVDESALLGVVGVQVKVERQSVVLYQVTGKLFYCVDCGLFLHAGVDIVSIEVLSKAVHAEMSVEDAVHVDHGYYHKHEHLFEQIGPYIFAVD
jgi:hypothetical protein